MVSEVLAFQFPPRRAYKYQQETFDRVPPREGPFDSSMLQYKLVN